MNSTENPGISGLPEKLTKPYDPQETEPRIYQMWEKSGYFNPDVCIDKGVTKSDAKPFTIIMPPPNVTGVLHMGHALMLTTEDIMIRYKRMQGFKTLWLPGTDHAAIATQSKVEKEISKKEGKSRYDLGREEMLKRIAQFAQESHDTITSQVRVIGSSCDWSREAFTLDAPRNLAVNTVFKKMYDDGLIYQGERIVNWDPKGQTTISDDEIVYTEEKTKFYYLKYGPFTIGTARPETKFGDKYVVMHPEDARYAEYKHGDKLTVEWINGPIEATIIKDESIDMEFGTGVMTITPWHSTIDFDIAEKHKLGKEQVIDKYGKLLDIAGPDFKGMKIKDAREKIIEKLQSKGLVNKIEDYTHNIPTAERTGGIIEPQIMKQWFVAVNKEFTLPHSQIKGIESGSKTTLKQIMKHTVESGQINIIPQYFDKTYFHWIENLRDWCISRQIWYGHRVPVFYDMNDLDNDIQTLTSEKVSKQLNPEQYRRLEERLQGYKKPFNICFVTGEEGNLIVSPNSSIVAKAFVEEEYFTWKEIIQNTTWFNPKDIKPKIFLTDSEITESHIQDEDTLDTWFSSALWTFSTLGWPNETADLKTFHPTDVLETGYEILFFWVARMILMSGYCVGQIPFHTVYLHGTVRDGKGQKMSKSLGNGLDPIDVAKEFGSDAGRMALVFGTAPGTDSKISNDKIKGYKHFANKMWNITRFVLQNTAGEEFDPTFSAYSEADLKLREERHNLIVEITKEMDAHMYHIASEKIYAYAWKRFADEILEESKKIFAEGTDADKKSRKQFLLHTLTKILKVLHPFMPFVTEELWTTMPQAAKRHDMIMVEPWPLSNN